MERERREGGEGGDAREPRQEEDAREHASSSDPENLQGPRKALRGGIQKSILTDFSGNMGDSRQMLTKMSQWLQEREEKTRKRLFVWSRDGS